MTEEKTKARLDEDKTAKPKTEIVGVFPAGKKSFFHNAESLLVRDVADYVPRNDRPQRKEALAALERYLTRYPDLRIGQALWAIATRDPFNIEDEEIIARVEPAEETNG